MKKKLHITAKVVSTFVLVVVCIGALPFLFAGDNPDFQTIPKYYFIKSSGIKLLAMIIITVCVVFVMEIWQKKPKQLA